MIEPDQLRNYHRQQVLYALQQGGEPMTASEVHEGMTTLALAMGHPRECAAITPAAVAGILRGMLGEVLVVQGEDRQNPRYGRGEPTWTAAAGLARVERPLSPGTRAVGAGATAAAQALPVQHQFRQITVDQRLAFLQAECNILLADIARDYTAFEQRVRVQISAFEQRAARLLNQGEDAGA
nr:hypothetical protein [Stenotrophomonas maltophilia]